MKILVIDTTSNALDLCMRWQLSGHDVRWFDRNRDDGMPRRAGEGIVEKIRNFDDLRKKWIGWADMIYVPDNTYYIDMLEPYRKLGYPIFGCNLAARDLELDREAGQKSMADAGMNIIEGKTFHDYDSAIAYVKKMGIAMVSKPSGDASKALSYVSNNAADLVFMLSRWGKNEKYRSEAKEHGFIIQEKKTGIEMAVGGWFGSGGWSRHFVENWEYKKLMNGDLSVNTGEMGSLARYVKSSKLATQVLLPITPLLEKIGYVGYVDNNCIIDDKGQPWPLEWTMRDGWPMRHNLNALHEGDQAQWMLDLINGKDTLKVKEGVVSISVVMAIPDFPYSKLTNREVSGIPIYNATDMEHIHLSEVMLSENVPTQVGDKVVNLPGYVSSGDYLLVATGIGETISGARRSAYSAIKKVKVPNSPFYRTDIGAGRMVKQLPQLHKMGYAKGLVM